MLDLSPLEDMKSWGPYDGKCPHPSAIERAEEFLHEVSDHYPPIPQPDFITVPPWGEEILIEWYHCCSVIISLYPATDRYSFWYNLTPSPFARIYDASRILTMLSQLF